MSKLEKMINSKNNSYNLSNLKFKKSTLNSKSTSNKNKNSFKIKYTTLAKIKKSNNKLSQIIINYFLNINEMDNSIEKIRVKLYSSQNFSAQNLFIYLDKNSQKYLTLNDFKYFLRENQISFSEKYLRKFIHNFDKNNDFCINYNEFLGIIYPKKNSPQYNSHSLEEGLEQESKKIFGDLICAELQFVEKCLELSDIVRNSKEFTTYEAFKEIAFNEKYINIKNLKNFFINKGIKINEKELNQLLFRIDKDNDGLISYDEFKDIFSPLNNFEIPNSKRNYNKDVLYQYDNDDENDDIQFDDSNSKDNIIKNSNNKKNYKYNFSIKSVNNSNNKENKENDKNQINIINKAEDRYNLNLETELDNVKNKKKQKKIISKTDNENNNSNSIHLYKENIKNIRTELDKNKKEYNRHSIRTKYKSVNNYNYYTHSHSNNSLVEQTKSVLGISHNNILNKIKINSLSNNNTIKKRTNINKKKKIIEIEYEKDYNMETPIREEETKFEYKKENKNNDNIDPLSDTILNFDYSRSTNRDRKNGTYYFKQKNKSENGESNNSTTNITNISENDNNTNKDKEIFWRNKSKIKNTNKRNSFSLEYNFNNLNNLFSFKDESNLNNNNNQLNDNSNNSNSNKNRNNFEFQNLTFDEKKYNNKKNNLNFNYIKDNKADIINNNINNVKINDREEQRYLDSLENIDQEKIEESAIINKKPKNQYHYNVKLTRNATRNNIQAQIQNKNKTKNNYIFKEIKCISNNIKDNQNKSCVFSYYKDKNNLFNNEMENINSNNYNNNEQKLCNNCESNRCTKCKCIKSENENFEELENDTSDSNINIYNINNNKVKKYENIKYKSTSMPKNINNNYNLNYSAVNINPNSNNINNKIYNRNNAINKVNYYRTNNMTVKNIYRNPPKNNNNNFNTNNSYYYMESSFNNNNFKIDQIKNNNNNTKNNVNNINNVNINSSKFTDLFNLFLDFIKQDSVVETMRQLLSGRDDSNLIDLFSLFDHSNNKIIFASDFIKSLKQFGMFINMDDIKFLYRKFNKKINDSFDLDEFSEIVLPKKHSNEKIMEIVDNNNYNDYPNDNSIKDKNKKNQKYFKDISTETKKMLGLLFKNIIDGEKSNENFRKILAENEELSGFDLFNKIKKNYSIGIYKEDIANFMKKNKYKLNNNEIELLMTRFDKNKNGMIDYKEFIIEISSMIKQ